MHHQRAVLFVNGELADGKVVIQAVRKDDYLIAVDGGLRVLLSLGLFPNLLIGDLDSISPAEVERIQQIGVEIRPFPPEKNETDLELALLAAAAADYQSIWLVAALGGRLDQTLANLHLLLLPELTGRDVRLFDGQVEVFLIRDDAVIHGQPGDTLSLIAFQGPATGITTHGLYYPLTDETLFPERSRGISNRMLANMARVTIETGVLLCIHTHDYLDQP